MGESIQIIVHVDSRSQKEVAEEFYRLHTKEFAHYTDLSQESDVQEQGKRTKEASTLLRRRINML